ncbi:MAG: CsgG/HfaB family protein [Bryobacteraceae bacterium]|nr:CsgG/HfaB family protein [Bryobacteraceae bacterium]
MQRKILASIFVLIVTAAASTAQERKRRVAVLNFEYGTVQSYVSSLFGTNVDVGKGVADVLVEKMVATGTYQVYERKALEKIMAEQNLSNSDRFDPATAARIGKLIGVDAIVMGSITKFGRDDSTTEIGAIGRVTGRYGISGVGKKKSKAVVALTARMVNIDTGEIMVGASGSGESTRSGTALMGSGGGQTSSGGGYYDMSSRNFASTLLGEAVYKAVEETARQLDASASRVTIRSSSVEGLVADVTGSTVVMNVGSRNGVKVGDKLILERPGREIRDPASGRVIKRITDRLGLIAVTEVDELSSTGTYSGTGEAKVGDIVKTSN